MKKDPKNPQALSYSDAGVNIDAGNELIQRIKPHVKRTARPEMISGLGGFNALFEVPIDRYKKPVLVSGTDGVGTKLKLALQLNKHESIGVDLVAMCVNDILVCGAEPLFFLDYYATGHLEVDVAETVIAGIADGCEQAGAALVGGETAEMPGMYSNGEYDLAGFTVGIVERDRIIDEQKVTTGDVLIGLASSGPHSNGYSLIRKVLEVSNADLTQTCGNTTLADALMAPTRIYVKTIHQLLKQYDIHSMSHITGGGLLENIPRTIPAAHKAIIDTKQWQLPEVFRWLQSSGNIEQQELFRTFNCGIGFVLCVKKEDANNILAELKSLGETAYQIGQIEAREPNEATIIIR